MKIVAIVVVAVIVLLLLGMALSARIVKQQLAPVLGDRPHAEYVLQPRILRAERISQAARAPRDALLAEQRAFQ